MANSDPQQKQVAGRGEGRRADRPYPAGHPVAALVPFGALAALDLLGRMLPSVADVAATLRPIDPGSVGDERPAPAPNGRRPAVPKRGSS